MQLTEQRIARVTGVDKRQIALLRKSLCSKAVDWDVEGAVVVYTRAGLEKILARLRLRFEDLPWERENEAISEGPAVDAGDAATDDEDAAGEAPASQPGPVPCPPQSAPQFSEERLIPGIVVRLSRNPILLVVRVEGREIQARCRSNENFVPGMPVHVREPAPGGDVWFYEGRLPRFKGRF